MDNLQMGIYKEEGIDKEGRGFVRFKPFGIKGLWTTYTVSNVDISDDNFITVNRFSSEDGIWNTYKILLTGSNGQARFANQKLKIGKLTEMIRKYREQVEKLEMEKAAMKAKERIMERGKDSVIHDAVKTAQYIGIPGLSEEKKKKKMFFKE